LIAPAGALGHRREAVPTLIAGVYGMNFEFMPELHWRWAYPVAGGAMVGACALLYARFKRAGWL